MVLGLRLAFVVGMSSFQEFGAVGSEDGFVQTQNEASRVIQVLVKQIEYPAL
jgi:hypothetical protein